jgi:methylamine dehydrogenase accessory protein MauD
MSNAALLVSYCILWVLVLCLCMTVYVLARHVGMLHIRTGNSSARMTNRGPEIGSTVNEVHFRDLNGQDVVIGGRQERHTLLVFISPGCQACNELVPALKSIARHERGVRLVIMAVAEEAETREYLKRHYLLHLSTVCSKDVVSLYGIAGIPHSLLLDRDGVVRTKGIVNTAVHLESILNAITTGYSSSQSRVLASEDV